MFLTNTINSLSQSELTAPDEGTKVQLSCDGDVPVIRSKKLLDGAPFVKTPLLPPNVKNIWELFRASCAKAGNRRPCMGVCSPTTDNISWQSFLDVETYAMRLGMSLVLPLASLASSPAQIAELIKKDTAPYKERKMTMITDNCLSPWTWVASSSPKVSNPASETCSPDTHKNELVGLSKQSINEKSIESSCADTSVSIEEGFQNSPTIDSSSHIEDTYQFRIAAARKWRSVGIFCQTSERKECFQLLLGAAAYGVTVILFGSDVSFDDVLRIVNKTQLHTIIGGLQPIRHFLNFLKTKTDNKSVYSPLANLISFGSVPVQEKLSAAQDVGIRILSWLNFLDMSRNENITPTPAATDRIAVVLFGGIDESATDREAAEKSISSGVMLTQRNLIASVAGLIESFSSNPESKKRDKIQRLLLSKDTVYYSYLSLLSPVEITLSLSILSQGGQVVYSAVSGESSLVASSRLNLDDNGWPLMLREIRLCNPTTLIAYNRFALMMLRDIYLESTIVNSSFYSSKLDSIISKRSTGIISNNPSSLNGFYDKNYLGYHLDRIFFSYGVDSAVLKALQIITKLPIGTFFGDRYTCGIIAADLTTPGVTAEMFQIISASIEIKQLSIKGQPPSPLIIRGAAVSIGEFLLDTTTPDQKLRIDSNGWYDSYRTGVIDEGFQSIFITEFNGLPPLTCAIFKCPFVLSAEIKTESKIIEVTISKFAQALWEEKQTKKKKPMLFNDAVIKAVEKMLDDNVKDFEICIQEPQELYLI